MPTLPEVFAEVVLRQPDAPAVLDASGREMSFGELARRSDGLAARFTAGGLSKGDRVLVALPVSDELYVVLAALWKAGLVAVFPEPALGLRGLVHGVRVTRPRAMVASGLFCLLALLPALWGMRLFRPQGPDATGGATPNVPLGPEDPALISFTSGTSGKPKSILRSHGFLMAQHAAVAPLLGRQTTPRDLVGFPVFVLVNLAAGRCSILPNWKLSRQDQADVGAIRDWIEASGATRLLLPPSICEKLAEVGVPQQVTALYTGGGPVFPDVLQRLRDGSARLKIVAVYGSTEAEPIADVDFDSIAPADWAEMADGGGLLAGSPVPGVSLRVQDGEVQVAGAHVNQGYMDPAQDADNKLCEDGVVWHRTGDAARLDGTGRLWLLGRWRGNTSGPQPLQVETAARGWPGVARAALVRMGDRNLLAVEGDGAWMDEWRERASKQGVAQVVHLKKLPLDRRHASKIDEKRLRKML